MPSGPEDDLPLPGDTPEEFGVWLAERLIEAVQSFSPEERELIIVAVRRRLKREGGPFRLA